MDSALNLLKQEINTTAEAERDLAKWKLAVTAALGAAAFGLAEHVPEYWLLLFVPFVCAYIDLYAYQMQLRILVIARFLREHAEGEPILQKYEEECQKLREPHQHVFDLNNLAGFSCSLFGSASGPILLYLLYRNHRAQLENLAVSFPAAATVWIVGVALIICLFAIYKRMERVLGVQTSRIPTVLAA